MKPILKYVFVLFLLLSTGAVLALPAGYIDVTSHSGVDPTGNFDSTAGLNAIIAQTADDGNVSFFPTGVYKVSNTIKAEQPQRGGSSTCGRTSKSIVLVGSSQGSKPKIVLSNNSSGFSGSPKPVVHILLPKDGGGERPNCAFAQVFRGIDIDVGSGNSGAVGIKMDAAQRSSLENVYIDATGGYAGVTAIPGRGMASVDIEVVGGDYGFNLDGTSLGGSLVDVTLRHQEIAAIQANVFRGLSITNFKIIKDSGPVITRAAGGLQNSNLVLTNGSIEVNSGAALNVSGGYLRVRNVFVSGASTLIDVSGRSNIASVGAGWSLIEDYSYTPGDRSNAGVQHPTINITNGNKNTNDRVRVSDGGSGPPNFFDTPTFATFEDAGVKTVTTKTGAAIQNAINSSDKVFVPKGSYSLSQTLNLKKDTQLFGVPGLRTHFNTTSGFSGDFMIRSPNDKDATTQISDISLDYPSSGAGQIHWRSGRNSALRSVSRAVSSKQTFSNDRKINLIDGNGGGRWYRWEVIDGTEVRPTGDAGTLVIRGTTEPLSLYGANPEHSKAPAVVIDNAANVRIFGTKTEGKSTPTLVVNNSNNIMVSAWMGNPKTGGAPYVILGNNTNIELSALARPGPDSSPVIKEGSVETGSSNFIGLYSRGQVDLSVWDQEGGGGSPPVNQAPTGNAGVNVSLLAGESVQLNGQGSDDGLPNNTLTYTWSVVSGPGVVTFSSVSSLSTNASFPVIGVYVLRLTVSDGELSSSDDVQITVTEESSGGGGGFPFGLPPNFTGVGFGDHIVITWDDVQDDIGYWVRWINTSPTVTFKLPENSTTVTYSGLDEDADYEFRIKTIGDPSDSNWSPRITVNTGSTSAPPPPPVNQAPTSLAGPDVSVVVGEAVQLNGQGSDDGLPDGTSEFLWSVVSGPGVVSIDFPSDSVVSATFDVEGEYILRLTLSDGELSGSDDVVVTVLPEVISLTLEERVLILEGKVDILEGLHGGAI